MRQHQFTSRLFRLILGLFFVFLTACSFSEEQAYNQAQVDIKNGNFREAVSSLEKITLTSPQTNVGVKAAREAARVCYFEIKDFKRAVKFYRLIILNSEDTSERLVAQKQVVSIYFDHLNDYQKAVLEINKLIPMLSNNLEKTEYKIKLARAYYYQNNFIQAENEVDEFLSKNISKDLQFDMYLLKGNINLAQKNLSKAADIFKKMISDFPERSAKENIGLTLSVCYEEMKDYKSAIETLEKIRTLHLMPEYIDIRINRLNDRLKNQPGARGRYRK